MAIISDNENSKKGIFSKFSGYLKNKLVFKKHKYHPKSLEELKELVNNNSIKLSQIDVSGVDSFEELFKDSKRTDFSGIENWNTSHIKNMRKMFYNCKNFNADISAWDVSNVSAMSMMFCGAKNFCQDLSSWDMSGMKGHLNGRFLGNMFRFADKMNQRIYEKYHELSEQNILPEERFDYLPIPKPKDYKKYVVANFSNDTKEIFEKIKDFKDLDTSTVESLDGTLENSDRKVFTNFDTLDFSMVKTADNFLSNAKYFNEKCPALDSVKYANGMLNGSYSFEQDVPSMTEVKQMNNFLSDVDYKGNLHDSLEKSAPVSAKGAFNKTSLKHLHNELKNVSTEHAVKKEFNYKTLDLIANMMRKSNDDYHDLINQDNNKDFLNYDPDNEYMVITLDTGSLELANLSKCLNRPIGVGCLRRSDRSIAYNAADTDYSEFLNKSFIISKDEYQKILNSNSDFIPPHLKGKSGEKSWNVKDHMLTFSLKDFNNNFLCNWKDNAEKFDMLFNLNGGSKVKSCFDLGHISFVDNPVLKSISYKCNNPGLSDREYLNYFNKQNISMINDLATKYPKAAEQVVKDIQNTLKCGGKGIVFNGELTSIIKKQDHYGNYRYTYTSEYSSDSKVTKPEEVLACDQLSVLVNNINLSLQKSSSYDNKTSLDLFTSTYNYKDTLEPDVGNPYLFKRFNTNKDLLMSTPSGLLDALHEFSNGKVINCNADLCDFKDPNKLICDPSALKQQDHDLTKDKNKTKSLEQQKTRNKVHVKSKLR